MIDYDDLAIKTFFLLKEQPTILRKYMDMFNNILVSKNNNLSYIDSRILSLLLDRDVYSEGEWIDYRYTNYRKK